MKGLSVDLIADIGFRGDRAKARDTLGRVYEYFLGKFAQAEKLGGEFFTPRCIVRRWSRCSSRTSCRVYDPCCGSAVRTVRALRGSPRGQKTDISIFGQESNARSTTWRLAHMNPIRGIEANVGSQPADSFLRNLHPDLKADYILANPPAISPDWSGKLLADDVRWRHGRPPVGNADYAWIQHFIHHLAPPNGHGGGVAGFVMANGSLSTGSGGEGEIRQRIVEADLVDCIVALPAQLFLTTGIPACLWFLTRDKAGRNLKHGGRDRKGETLFIDARKLGTMRPAAARAHRRRRRRKPLEIRRRDRRPANFERTSVASSTPSASGAASLRPIGGMRRSTVPVQAPTATSLASVRPRRSWASVSTVSCLPPVATSVPRSRRTTASRSRRSTRAC